MNIRQVQLLRMLYPVNTSVFSGQVAEFFGVSKRTISNDVKNINGYLKPYGASIVRDGNQELSLYVSDNDQFNKFIEEVLYAEERIPVEREDRVHFLLRKFLLNHSYHKLEDVAEELYVSRSTVQNDIKDVKVILNQFGLELHARPNYGLIISGNEQDIRNAISELLFERYGRTVMNPYHQEWLIESHKMEKIYNSVLSVLEKFRVSISDIALNNLAIHIAIAYHRIKEKKVIEGTFGDKLDLSKELEYKMAQEILLDIESYLEVKFPAIEIQYVAMHLMGTRLAVEKSLSTEDEIGELVMKIISEADARLNLGVLSDKELFIAIMLHLKPAINRFKFNMNIRNPMLEAIKENYPLAFDASVIASTVIKEELGVIINEDEMGYIALHFGAAIERKKMITKPLNFLIVCASGMGSAQLLLYKLKRKFGHRINIVGTVDYYRLQETKLDEIDHILTTIPLSPDLIIPWTMISDIFGDKDYDVVERLIINRGDFSFRKYLIENLIYLNLKLDSPESVISFLSQELNKTGLVLEDITESVLHREKVAPTSFGHLVAMPHPVEPMSHKTFLTVATLKEPIDWYGKQVQFVILLNVAQNLDGSLEPLYKHLIELIDDYERVKQCIEAESKTELIRLICKV